MSCGGCLRSGKGLWPRCPR